jgi:hypothetical protein
MQPIAAGLLTLEPSSLDALDKMAVRAVSVTGSILLRNNNEFVVGNNLIIPALIIAIFLASCCNLFAKRETYRQYGLLFPMAYILAHIITVATSNYFWFLPRYKLNVYPFFFIIASIAIVDLFRKRWLTLIVVALIALNQIGDTYKAIESDRVDVLENNMEYADYVAAHMQALKFIERTYPDVLITSSDEWGEKEKFNFVTSGYVSRPLNYVDSGYVKTTPGVFPGIFVSGNRGQPIRSIELGDRRVGLEVIRGFCSGRRCAYVYKINYSRVDSG